MQDGKSQLRVLVLEDELKVARAFARKVRDLVMRTLPLVGHAMRRIDLRTSLAILLVVAKEFAL
jgi:hypothetical protein